MTAVCPQAAWLRGPKRKSSAYLSHQLGEVRGVPGRQPQQRPSAGVQRRAVAHDQDDARCGGRDSSGPRRGGARLSFDQGAPKLLGRNYLTVPQTPDGPRGSEVGAVGGGS